MLTTLMLRTSNACNNDMLGKIEHFGKHAFSCPKISTEAAAAALISGALLRSPQAGCIWHSCGCSAAVASGSLAYFIAVWKLHACCTIGIGLTPLRFVDAVCVAAKLAGDSTAFRRRCVCSCKAFGRLHCVSRCGRCATSKWWFSYYSTSRCLPADADGAVAESVGAMCRSFWLRISPIRPLSSG